VNGYNIDKVFGFGTAALRSAENGQEFIEEVKKKTGFDIQLISGDEEATLIYYGVRQVVQIGKEISLIMDIGGGSVEFILGNDEQIFWKQSFKLGAALLQGKFQPQDPLSADDINKIHSLFESELQPLLSACELFKPHQLIGSAGSFETFSNMIKHRFAEQSGTINKSPQSISITHFDQLYSDLIVSTKEQRNEMKGLVKMRVDMIVMAALLLKFVLTKVPLNKMILSTYALKEGALWKMIQDYKKM